VGDILDLLWLQTALENARALQVRSRADWYLAVARLARDTGTLTRTSPLPMAHDASPPEKDDQK
jgi:outer membrane protein TolC